MIFKEKEVIELSGGKKYIVAKVINRDDCWYYGLFEVNNAETKVYTDLRIITTVSENGNIFIKNVKGKLAEELENQLKKELNIDFFSQYLRSEERRVGKEC